MFESSRAARLLRVVGAVLYRQAHPWTRAWFIRVHFAVLVGSLRKINSTICHTEYLGNICVICRVAAASTSGRVILPGYRAPRYSHSTQVRSAPAGCPLADLDPVRDMFLPRHRLWQCFLVPRRVHLGAKTVPLSCGFTASFEPKSFNF